MRDMQHIDKLWDDCLKEQIPEPYTGHHGQAAVDCLEMWVPKVGGPGSALDVGCGTGWLREWFTQRGWTYRGNSLQDGADIPGDFHFMALEPADLVFCRHVVEHSPMPILAMAKLYEFTKPGGWCIMITPTPPWYAEWPQHFSVMPRGSWVGLINRMGFIIEQVMDVQVGDRSMETRFLLRRPAEEVAP